MNLAETSLAAFHTIDLDRREREVLAHIQAHFPTAEFTRAELADSMGWKINRICGRILSLRDKQLLTEDKTRTVKCKATGGDAHPLRLAQKSKLNGALDTTSEEFRHACEVRFVANLPNDAARNKYLTGVHEKRGEAAWKRLREDAWRLMRVAA